MTIQFGTDGWRAVISDTFTFGNLRLVSQAIADAVLAEGWLAGPLAPAAQAQSNGAPGADPRQAVVGFDTRFLSDRYAVEVARVLAANGLTVRLTNSDAPTPAVSLAVKRQGAAAGVMITASHNAPRYNGVKLKAAYGGSALPEQCRRVEICLNDNEARARGPNLMDYEQAVSAGLISRFNPVTDYYEHLRSLISLDTISNYPDRLRVVVDSMYGSGRGYIKGFLQGTGCEVMEIRGEMNPGFGGVHPEPIARYLQATAAAIAAGHGDLGLVTDGDADRTGAMDGRGDFVDPHKIFALALKYLVEKRGWRGAVVRTVSTTRMVDRLAARYNLPVHETPVGFNHIADHILADDVLIGGEESGGISIRGHIPEGDGILMGLLLLEIVADARAPLSELVAGLLKDVGPAFYARKDMRLARPVAKAEMTRRLAEEAPGAIGGQAVARVETRDGVKYVMADDSWLLIRPSGTEPVLRVYAEAREEPMVASLLGFGEAAAAS